jgi:hypothetical protein
MGTTTMPAKSRKQQKLLFAKFGEQWVKAHHFDKIEKSKKPTTSTSGRRRSDCPLVRNFRRVFLSGVRDG